MTGTDMGAFCRGAAGSLANAARCWAGLVLVVVLLHGPAGAGESRSRIERVHDGVHLVALPPKPGKEFDTSLVPGGKGLDNIERALDRLVARSPMSARALATLKREGRVLIAYVPDDLRGPTGDGEAVALYVPQHLRDPEREKTFYVMVGRHGVKWPATELAAVLAHELLGHGLQDYRGRFSTTRILDLECEAYLHEEIANQDLGLDKFSREMITFRQTLEQHWCAEFKAYMRAHRGGDLALWDALNPDIPKLLDGFAAYTQHLHREGISSKAIAAARRQFRERVDRALETQVPAELYNAAVVLRDGGVNIGPDLPAAFQYFLAAAERGHAEAMLNAARMYEKGTGVEKDMASAVMWYREAAEAGGPKAQTYYGWMHLNGNGVATDYDPAFHWLTRASDQHEAQAAYYLATMYRLGLGRERDQKQAVALYRTAALTGHAEAQYRLGWHLYRGIGVEKDEAAAAQWIRQAAERGLAVSQNSLGWMYARGTGVEKDPVRAVVWFAKAAVQGYASAQVTLASMYQAGDGVPRNPVAAYVWYSAAAAEGHAAAEASRIRLGQELSPDQLAEANRRIAERKAAQ
jgi:TPR repeat protein